MHAADERFQQLTHWVKEELGLKHWQLAPASEDASFRRYFRASLEQRSFIVMDAPPDKENTASFIDITRRLLQADVKVPQIHAKNVQQGFLLLDDLGQTALLPALHAGSAATLYGAAMQELRKIQRADSNGLPDYNADLLGNEMALFPQWFLQTHLGLILDDARQAILHACFDALKVAALEQPRVFVHRDYHSRNLMLQPGQGVGVIDYQDAVFGPVTYDLVSLLRDCYIDWPAAQVTQWQSHFLEPVAAQLQLGNADLTRWFDLMGIQRHLKAVGIFARLWHRDGKPGYLADIPRTLGYIRQVAPRYAETAGLAALIDELDLLQRLPT